MLNGKKKSVSAGRRSRPAGGFDDASATENAVEGAVRELRRMIFDGELRAGQALGQEDLALLLGTSRHPVREALGRLSGEGLVNFRPRFGYQVRALGPSEIAEIFEIRMMLEEHAGYTAALQRDAATIAEAEKALSRMAAMIAKKQRNISLWSKHNRAFHAHLYAASGRPHLCRMIETLRDSIETYVRMSVPAFGFEQIHAEHERIFAAFRDGDAALVARLCRQHVRHTAHTLVDRLRTLQASGHARADDELLTVVTKNRSGEGKRRTMRP